MLKGTPSSSTRSTDAKWSAGTVQQGLRPVHFPVLQRAEEKDGGKQTKILHICCSCRPKDVYNLLASFSFITFTSSSLMQQREQIAGRYRELKNTPDCPFYPHRADTHFHWTLPSVREATGLFRHFLSNKPLLWSLYRRKKPHPRTSYLHSISLPVIKTWETGSAKPQPYVQFKAEIMKVKIRWHKYFMNYKRRMWCSIS